jgi:hypothetical protein
VEKMEKEKEKEAKGLRGLAKAYYDVQRLRISLGNILRHEHSRHEFIEGLFKQAEANELELERMCTRAVESVDIYIAFLSKVKGIGPTMAAYIIDYFDIYKADHVSSFWQFSGLAPGCKREKGKKVIYNPTLKSIMLGRVFKQLMLAKGFYYDYYNKCKEELKRTHPEWAESKATIGKYHARARLKTMKLFEAHLWSIWRELRGLPVTKPYSTEKLGHAYIPPPIAASNDKI